MIGISAVDGRGTPFKGGGRVVKNVAGYDFCKLLIGSLGTLGVISQLTFKVKPTPETSVSILAECADLDTTERILADLVHAPAPPAAIDFLVGVAWDDVLQRPNASSPGVGLCGTVAVRFEGTESESNWMQRELEKRLVAAGGEDVRVLDSAGAERLLQSQVGFPDRGITDNGAEAPLVIKLSVRSSAVTEMVAQLQSCDPACTIQAHAASGIIVVRLANFEEADLSTLLISRLRPAAVRYGGNLTVLDSRVEGLTPQVVWGGRVEASQLMERIKDKFDPHDILNRGRFVF